MARLAIPTPLALMRQPCAPRETTGGRAMVARLGVLTVLFQAILFGWHHHGLTFSGRLPVPVVENHSAAPQVTDDEDGCEICQVLHHLTAAPVEFPAVGALCATAAGPDLALTAFIAYAHDAAFQARAPPSSAAATG
jgi:hypothetical protein